MEGKVKGYSIAVFHCAPMLCSIFSNISKFSPYVLPHSPHSRHNVYVYELCIVFVLLLVSADKSLRVSLVGDSDEAKAFQGGSSPREDSGNQAPLSLSLSFFSILVLFPVLCVCVCVCG